MKAKKILGIIACASACVSLSAFGNTICDWFGVSGIVDTTVTPAQNKAQNDGCDVTDNGVSYVPNGEEEPSSHTALCDIVLDNDKSAPFRITPTAATTMSDGVAEIYGKAILTPSNTNDFEVTEGAKVGFAVGIATENNVTSTNFYGYANGAWHKLSGQSANYDWAGWTGFKLVIDYRVSNVKFYIGSDEGRVGTGTWTALVDAADASHNAFAIASGTTSVVGIDAFGSGKVYRIYGGFEVAMAEYNGVKYGSLSEAVTVAGGSTTGVKCVNSSGEAVASPANGLAAWECAALGIDPTETLTFEPAAADKMVSDKITVKAVLDHILVKDMGNPTYNVVTAPDSNYDVVYDVYQGATRIDGGYTADAVKIPMGTGSYTVKPVITPKQ